MKNMRRISWMNQAKQVVSLLLCLTIISFYMLPAIHVNAVDDETKPLTTEDYVKEVLSYVVDVNQCLELLGVTFDDLNKIPKKDSAFYERLFECLVEMQTGDDPSAPTVDPNINWEKVFNPDDEAELQPDAKLYGDLWGYAYKMAKLNKQRDPKARTLYQETKDMFMSHYVDIKSGPEFQVIESRSDDGYYSAWITDLDRKQYDIYYHAIKRAKVIEDEAKFTVNMMSLGQQLKSDAALIKLKKISAVLTNLSGYKSYVDGRKAIREYFDSYCDRLADTYDPRAFVNTLVSSLKTADYGEDTKDYAINVLLTFVSVGSIGLGGVLSSLISTSAAFLVSFDISLIKDLYDKARWTTLIYTNGMRVAERAKRYYKEEYGIGLGLDPFPVER